MTGLPAHHRALPDPADSAADTIETARRLWADGAFDAAVALLDAAVAKAEGSDALDAVLIAFIELLYSGREGWQFARTLVEARVQKDGAPQLGFLRAAARHRKAIWDPQRAASWDAVLAVLPEDPEALHGRLGCALRMRDRAAITAFAGRCRAIAGEGSKTAAADLLQVGDAALIDCDLPEAMNFYGAASAAEPDSPAPLIGQAVATLDAGDAGAAAALLEKAAGLYGTKRSPLDEMVVRNAAAAWARPGLTRGPAPVCEVFIFSHFHHPDKLRENAHLGGPGTGLIAATLRSLRATLQLRPQVPVTVLYDHRPTAANEAYRAALGMFCAAEGVQLVVNEQFGLRGQWLDAARRARADLLFMVEHDHEFLPNSPSLATLLQIFAARPEIQHLKLPRRRLIVKGFDTILTQTAQDRAAGLCCVPAFSNTPHLLRRSLLDNVVVPIIGGTNEFEGRNAGAAGVEEAVNVAYRQVELVLGLPAAMRLFGTYSFGQPGQERCLVHLGV